MKATYFFHNQLIIQYHFLVFSSLIGIKYFFSMEYTSSWQPNTEILSQ